MRPIWPFRPWRLLAGLRAAPQSDLEQAIVIAVNAAAIASGGCFPLHVPENAGYPAITYKLAPLNYGKNLDGPDGTATARIQFACQATAYGDAKNLALAVRNLFDGLIRKSLSGVVILSSWADEASDEYTWADDGSDEGTFMEPIEIVFKHQVAKPAR